MVQGIKGLHLGAPEQADGFQVGICMGKRWYWNFVYEHLGSTFFPNIPGSSLSSYTVLDFDPSLSEFSLHIDEFGLILSGLA